MNSKRPKLVLMSGITSALLLYKMATAAEAPSRALAIQQYGFSPARWPACLARW